MAKKWAEFEVDKPSNPPVREQGQIWCKASLHGHSGEFDPAQTAPVLAQSRLTR
jgi:hypothetical protein